MWRKLTGMILGIACMSMVVGGVADAAAAKRARAPKVRKPTMEETIRKAVDEAIKDSLPAASGKYEFAAKRMRPPKGKKWTKRWNEMGQSGWQLVGSNENIYIFQRPGAVDVAAADNKKADKKAAADTKKANKEAEKATKEADKQAKKAAKEAEKAAKKAAKSK
jgi:hypothetical protein